MNDKITLLPIGHIRSPYLEKFGIPRQSGLAPAAIGQLILRDDLGLDSLRGLDGFSHLWLTFLFHKVAENETRQLVRPPRLGGNEKIGVFASRSPFRPNRLGLSLVEYLGYSEENGRLALNLGGLDHLDGTPVLDLKPYLPFLESKPDARGGFAPAAPRKLAVTISPEIREVFAKLSSTTRELITQSLALDPRPAYHDDPHRIYICLLADRQIHWRADEVEITIIAVENAIAHQSQTE